MREFLKYLYLRFKPKIIFDYKDWLKRFFIVDKVDKVYKPYRNTSIYTRELLIMGLILSMCATLFYGTNGIIYTYPLEEHDAIYAYINGQQPQTYEELAKEFEKRKIDGPEKLNINTATKKELMALEGIGERISERILAYRYENKRFNSIYDLLEIEGFSQAKLLKIQDQITV